MIAIPDARRAGLLSREHWIKNILVGVIVILVGITARYGIEGLHVTTLMAGVMLMLMGLTRSGGVIKYSPDPLIVGFTAASPSTWACCRLRCTS